MEDYEQLLIFVGSLICGIEEEDEFRSFLDGDGGYHPIDYKRRSL